MDLGPSPGAGGRRLVAGQQLDYPVGLGKKQDLSWLRVIENGAAGGRQALRRPWAAAAVTSLPLAWI